jgi:dTDP-L-rhamnose 4-epimerase
VLITGGAGSVGSHVADRLAADGHDVLLLDALLPQAPGNAGWAPPHEQVVGDVRNDERRVDLPIRAGAW